MLALSGAGALVCEIVWMRRLALLSGSSALAVTATLALYMGGLGVGGLLGARRTWTSAPRGYGCLEGLAAAWAVGVPTWLQVLEPLTLLGPEARLGVAAAVLVPPALLHGATLPALAPVLPSSRDTSRLYAANTAGAVVGVLVGTFVLLPVLGVRGTELVGAGCAGAAALWALGVAPSPAGDPVPLSRVPRQAPLDRRALVAACAAGACAMGLEVAWSRLGALLLGGSVYAFALVLATFLVGIAAGASLGRRHGRSALAPALGLLGCAALASTLFWRGLPHALGLLWTVTGPTLWLPAAAGTLGLTFLGVPLASGAVFAAALDQPTRASRVAGAVLASNTLGSVLGAAATGLWVLPAVGLRASVLATGLLALVGAVGIAHRAERSRVLGLALVGGGLVLVSPRWDPALYAVGVGLRVHEFSDLSPRAVERFAHDGWTLRSYEDGRSASVAVGQSTRTGNLWLSLNGKVDASTGDDMPTQVLSGALPVALLRQRDPTATLHAGVVGLASGITARAALDAGADRVTVVELEPAVVRAAEWFSEHNGDLLNDPRVTVIVDDARAVLRRPGPPFDVLVSEPSNPWITGVSNLFTQEYWRLGRARLRPGGLFVQWLQLYALPPDALRGLVRTFLTVFDEVWLFETIPGADAVLIGTTPGASIRPEDVAQLPLRPVLDPDGCRRLAGRARLNTDDQPWVEFAAPRWIHRQTNQDNAARIRAAAQP